jgi:hypothetical protein
MSCLPFIVIFLPLSLGTPLCRSVWFEIIDTPIHCCLFPVRVVPYLHLLLFCCIVSLDPGSVLLSSYYILSSCTVHILEFIVGFSIEKLRLYGLRS